MTQNQEAQKAIAGLLESGNKQFFESKDYDSALGQYRDAYSMARKLQQARYEAFAANNIGLVYTKAGQYERARISYEQALKMLDQVRLTGEQSSIEDEKSTVRKNMQILVDTVLTDTEGSNLSETGGSNGGKGGTLPKYP
ncbi:MAG: tetratricopeptide repeat protein [Elainellaceae cyanobacterium]